MLVIALFAQVVLTMPDGSTVDFGSLNNLHILNEDHQFVVSCPFGKPAQVLMAYSENEKALEQLPAHEEVALLLKIGKTGEVEEYKAFAYPHDGEITVLAPAKPAIWKRLEKSRSVVVEVEYNNETISSQRFEQLGSEDGESVAWQGAPCE